MDRWRERIGRSREEEREEQEEVGNNSGDVTEGKFLVFSPKFILAFTSPFPCFFLPLILSLSGGAG